MSNYTANPRSKSMVLEVERLLRQLGVHEAAPDPSPPDAAPMKSASPARSTSMPRGASPPRSVSPLRNNGIPRREDTDPAAASRNGGSVPNTTGTSERAERAANWARVALWARVSLCLTLGVAMTQWPYRIECGWALSGYLSAVAAVMVAGGWTAFASWRARSGPAHILSLMLIFWGFVLAAEQSLPRIGYAAEAASWSCPSRGTSSATSR